MRTYRRSLILAVAIAMGLCTGMVHAFGDSTELSSAGLLAVPDGFEGGEVLAINSLQEMAGFCFDSYDNASACIWVRAGYVYLLNAPDGVLDFCPYSAAVAMNERRDTIGYAWDGTGHLYGFIWRGYSGMTALGVNGGDDCTFPCAINNSDQVVGYSYNSDDLLPLRHGFLWEAGEVKQLTWAYTFPYSDQEENLPIIPARSPIRSINEAGQIVGTVWDDPFPRFSYHPVILWDQGVTTELNPGVGGTNARINRSGQVVADSDSGGVWLYTPGEEVRDLDVGSQYPTDPDNTDTEFGSARAMGLNDLGQVLIQAQDVAATPACRLFLWQDDGTDAGSFTEIPLSQLLEAGDGFREIEAYMNEMGQVACLVENLSATYDAGLFWDHRKPQDLTILGAGSAGMFSLPTALNDLGIVAGYTNAGHGCVWDTRPAPTEVELPTDCAETQAFAINDSGQIVGFGSADAPMDPLIWQNGVAAVLPLPEGFTAGAALDINASGQVVGGCADTDLESRACRWELVDGAWTATLLGLPEGYTAGSMLWISDAGQMIGQCYREEQQPFTASYFQDGPTGTPTVLLYGDIPILPYQMNASGQVAGLLEGEPYSAVLRNPDGAVVEIAPNAEMVAINDLGQAVGSYFDREDWQYKSFLYLPAEAYGLSAGLHTTLMNTAGRYYAINNAGLVFCGNRLPMPYSISTDVWINDLATGATHYLGKVPGDLRPSWFSNAVKMTDSGLICGTFSSSSVEINGSFYASIQDGLVFLGDLGGYDSYALSINASGMIAGYSELPWDPGLEYSLTRACVWRADASQSNQTPVANAGSDQAMAVGAGGTAAVVLDGSGSSDPDGDDLSYAWSENGSQIASGMNPTVSLGVGTHAIVLTVTDPYGASSQDQVSVTVSALSISDVTATPRNAKVMTITVLLTNPSDTETAYDVTVIAASLDGVYTNSRLPLVYGAIKPGTTKQCTLQFKEVPSGSQTLIVKGTSSLGDFSTAQTVNVP